MQEHVKYLHKLSFILNFYFTKPQLFSYVCSWLYLPFSLEWARNLRLFPKLMSSLKTFCFIWCNNWYFFNFEIVLSQNCDSSAKNISKQIFSHVVGQQQTLYISALFFGALWRFHRVEIKEFFRSLLQQVFLCHSVVFNKVARLQLC